jgi:DNA-binding CsgD family transcriptional regulator
MQAGPGDRVPLARARGRRDRGLLSPRERDCLLWLASGLRTREIAARMGLARVTVDLHLRNARRKLGAATLPQAVAKAVLDRQIRLV